MAFTFEQVFAADPSTPGNVAQNAAVTIFAPGDETMTPLTITDPDGQALANPIIVNSNGFGPAFAHATLDRVAWAGGGFTGFFTSYEGMKNEAVAAKEAAEAVQQLADSGALKGDKGDQGDRGIDGSNVIPTATAIATATNSILASVDGYPGIDKTGAASSSVGLQAAVNATPDGGKLIIPAGTYLIDATVSSTGKTFQMDARGATFIKTANVAMFDFVGGYETPLAVSTVAPTTITDDTTGSDPGTAITVTAGPTTWVRGDVIKIYADDVVPGGRPGSAGNEARVGQFLVVSNVTGNVINCLGTLDDAYTTNIRVAKILDKAVHVTGGVYITAPEGLTGSWSSNMIQFRSMVGPTLREAQVKSASYTAVRFTGCYGYTVDSLDVGYAKNDALNFLFGYGIQDASSSYGRISRYRARRVRHAYTDGTAFQAAATADPANYGRTYGTQISDSVVYGSANTGWDTHSWSQNVTFTNVQAVNSYKGFNARGRYHKFINCQSIKCSTGGINIANESDGGDSFGHYVKDFYAEGTPTRAIEVNLNQVGHPSAGTRETRKTIIDGATIVGGGADSVYISNGTVRLDKIRHTAPAAAVTTSERYMVSKNSVVEGDNWVFDTRPVTSGTGMSLIRLESSSVLTLGTARYVTSTANAGVLSFGIDSADTTSAATVVMLTCTHPIPTPWRNLADGSFVDWESLSDGQNSAWVTASDALIASATGPVQNLARTRAPKVWFRLTANGGAQNLAAFQAGGKRGQELVVWNISTTNTVTVRHGAATYKTNLTAGVDKALAPQERITFVWQNSTWWQIA